MSISVKDERLNEIINPVTQLETVCEGFTFIEGPIWHPREHHLTFSDIRANRMLRYRDGDGVTIYRDPSNMANGNTYDRQGRMLTCEHATSRVVRESNGKLEVIASHYDGKELNSPNDIVVDSRGDIFFTDPTYGRIAPHGVARDVQLDFRGVYRLDTRGNLTVLASDFETPNGLCFGLDEKVLFIADTRRRHIRRFEYDGEKLTGGDVLCDSPAPDGLKIDSAGNLYAGGPGISVYDPAGKLLGIIETPAFCANFAWGGADLHTLYLTSSTTLYRVPVKVAGLPLFD